MENNKGEFSDIWWDDFLKSSENLNKPTSIDDAFSDNTSDQLLKKTMDIFKSFDEEAAFRVWVNGEQRPDFNEILMNNPPQEKDTIETWTSRIFGKQKFGIIFNQGERWNKELNIELFQKIKPLLSKVGYPMMGIDVTIFIGNYGWTPLGIHIDYIGESVMHFHLGEGKKQMYLWDKSLYQKDLKGEIGEKRPEFFVHKSTKYELKKGSVFYMPWGMPHIGKSDEISAAISVWFNKPTKQKILKKVISNINHEYVSDEKTFQEQHNSFQKSSEKIETINFQKDPTKDIFTDFIEGNIKNDFINKTSYSNLIKIGTKDFLFAIKSNLNFSYPLKQNKSNINTKISENTLLSLDFPYKIEYYHSKITNKFHIFIKGEKIMLFYHEDIINLIDRLNSFKTMSAKTLLKGLFIDLPTEAHYRILEIFCNRNGILIKNTITKTEMNTVLDKALSTTK